MFFQFLAKRGACPDLTPAQEHEAGLSVFIKTLGVLLPEDEGVVVNLNEGDEKVFGFKRAIVYNKGSQINIMEESRGFLEGQRIVIQ